MLPRFLPSGGQVEPVISAWSWKREAIRSKCEEKALANQKFAKQSKSRQFKKLGWVLWTREPEE
eukprot:821618-Prorocentrum_lima.AAC.1